MKKKLIESIAHDAYQIILFTNLVLEHKTPFILSEGHDLGLIKIKNPLTDNKNADMINRWTLLSASQVIKGKFDAKDAKTEPIPIVTSRIGMAQHSIVEREVKRLKNAITEVLNLAILSMNQLFLF